MPIILPDNHFALTASDAIEQICTPLKLLGITYFHYVKLYPNGSTVQLINRALHLRDFYAKGLYLCGRFEYPNQHHVPGYVLSSTLDSAAQQIFSYAREYHDIDHVLTISKKNQENWGFYHFGGPKNFFSLPSFYLSNLDLLERFILYFHEKAEKIIIQASKQRIYHPTNASTKNSLTTLPPLDPLEKQNTIRQQFLEQLAMEKFSLIDYGQKIVLTKRETDCLREWFKGYPAREIAQKLAVSPRTVETHIMHVKDKLQCNTKTQLIDKLQQNNFELLLQDLPISQ